MDRDTLLNQLTKVVYQRNAAREHVIALKNKLVPAEKQLTALEKHVNQLIQALYPSTLPSLPQEHEGRVFRNEDGEAVPVPVPPQQTANPEPELTIQTSVNSASPTTSVNPNVIPITLGKEKQPEEDPQIAAAIEKMFPSAKDITDAKKLLKFYQCFTSQYDSGLTWKQMPDVPKG